MQEQNAIEQEMSADDYIERWSVEGAYLSLLRVPKAVMKFKSDIFTEMRTDVWEFQSLIEDYRLKRLQELDKTNYKELESFLTGDIWKTFHYFYSVIMHCENDGALIQKFRKLRRDRVRHPDFSFDILCQSEGPF